MSRIDEQAWRDAEIFWDNHDMPEIFKRYAYVSNKARVELEKIGKKEKHGFRIRNNDYEDYQYYKSYHDMLAVWIANSYLADNGYEQDENGMWSAK